MSIMTLLIMGQYIFTDISVAFNFIVLSDLNSNVNNLIEIFLYQRCFIQLIRRLCATISFAALKISNLSLSGLVLINSQPIYYSVGFKLFISWSIFSSLCSYSSLSIESLYS